MKITVKEALAVLQLRRIPLGRNTLIDYPPGKKIGNSVMLLIGEYVHSYA
jgi:hypothetical protein